jgi:hypothetical protein
MKTNKDMAEDSDDDFMWYFYCYYLPTCVVSTFPL